MEKILGLAQVLSNEGSGGKIWILFMLSLTILRKSLWASLSNLNPFNLHWIVMGDFNIIKQDDEKLGGILTLHFAKAYLIDIKPV